jgi:hypothetical protein
LAGINGKGAVLLEILSGSFVLNIGREYCQKKLAEGIIKNIVRKHCHKDWQESLTIYIDRRY